jgi:putative flippase GtrA
MPAGVLAYGAAGIAGTVAHYTVLILLVQLQGAEPVAASTFGAATGAIVNYWLNHRITFRSTVPHQRAFIRFMFVAAAGMIINAATLFVAVRQLGVHYLLGQVAATGVAFLVTYELNRRWTF